VIRVVVDANVFVSSFFGGNPRRIIDLWKNGNILLCLSPEIIDEYIEVLQRLALGYEGELRELLRLFAKGYHIISTHAPPSFLLSLKIRVTTNLLNALWRWIQGISSPETKPSWR
jgi:predicted nucleic acid-binding protein